MKEDSSVLLMVVVGILVASFLTMVSCEKRGKNRIETQRWQSVTNREAR